MHSLFFYCPERRGRHARLVYKIRSREGLPAVAYQLRVSHLIVPHLYFPVLYHGLRRIVKSFLLGDLECTDGVPIGGCQALCVIESDIGGVIGKRCAAEQRAGWDYVMSVGLVQGPMCQSFANLFFSGRVTFKESPRSLLTAIPVFDTVCARRRWLSLNQVQLGRSMLDSWT